MFILDRGVTFRLGFCVCGFFWIRKYIGFFSLSFFFFVFEVRKKVDFFLVILSNFVICYREWKRVICILRFKKIVFNFMFISCRFKNKDEDIKIVK